MSHRHSSWPKDVTLILDVWPQLYPTEGIASKKQGGFNMCTNMSLYLYACVCKATNGQYICHPGSNSQIICTYNILSTVMVDVYLVLPLYFSSVKVQEEQCTMLRWSNICVGGCRKMWMCCSYAERFGDKRQEIVRWQVAHSMQGLAFQAKTDDCWWLAHQKGGEQSKRSLCLLTHKLRCIIIPSWRIEFISPQTIRSFI